MLDRLDDVPWEELEHAYGSARDVPGQIRDLLSRRGERRERALFELFGNIHHQGTVYEATAPAVPFLAEVALAPEADPHVRVQLLWLLAAIASGTSYLDVHRPYIEEVGESVDENDLAEELAWVKAARAAVGGRLAELLALAKEDDPRFALAVADLAARLPEQGELSVPVVRRLWAGDGDPRRRRLYATALLLLGERSPDYLAALRSAPADDVEPEYRVELVATLERDGRTESAEVVLEDLHGAALR